VIRKRAERRKRAATAVGVLLIVGVLSPCTTKATVTPASPTSAPADDGPPATEVRVLNDNGAWSWWQGPRVLITRDGRLLAGTVPHPKGSGGRNGFTEVTELDLRSDRVRTHTLDRRFRPDDHNSAALAELDGGTVVAAWTGHSTEPYVRTAHQSPRDLSWEIDPPVARPESGESVPNGGGFGPVANTTYSNLLWLQAENDGQGRLYDFFRGRADDPAVMWSDDRGRTWTYGGTLFEAPRHRPYAMYATDGRDRIDFTVSGGHPHVTRANPVYHGYIRGGSMYRSDGEFVARLGDEGVQPEQFTLVWRSSYRNNVSWDAQYGASTQFDDTDAWSSDLEWDHRTSSPVITFSVRFPRRSPVPGKVFEQRAFHARWTGRAWAVRDLAFAGSELYRGQLSYSGLSAIDPADPDRVVLSTNVDPATNEPLVSRADGRVHWELFEARRPAAGGTWSWTPVTTDSSADNLRPVIPAPAAGHSALVWLRGRYANFEHDYDLDLVGLIDG